jgi:hypothetical protein
LFEAQQTKKLSQYETRETYTEKKRERIVGIMAVRRVGFLFIKNCV